jgi:hypothetical protein
MNRRALLSGLLAAPMAAPMYVAGSIQPPGGLQYATPGEFRQVIAAGPVWITSRPWAIPPQR